VAMKASVAVVGPSGVVRGENALGGSVSTSPGTLPSLVQVSRVRRRPTSFVKSSLGWSYCDEIGANGTWAMHAPASEERRTS
jgi:hypothetical protein